MCGMVLVTSNIPLTVFITMFQRMKRALTGDLPRILPGIAKLAIETIL